MKRLSGLAVIATIVALSGCGSTTVTTVTEHVTPAASPSTTTTAASSVAEARSPTPRPERKPTKKRTKKAVAGKPTTNWVACDGNIFVLRPRTSCAFAQNAFYEYWTADGDSPLQVYSPAAGQSLSTRCLSDGSDVRCATDDGGRVRFSASAIAAYSAGQADAYAASHETGADSTSATTGGSDSDYDDGSSGAETYDETGDEIPNYDNGTGYRVRCADGMYSQSGGRPGACSGHGGVGR